MYIDLHEAINILLLIRDNQAKRLGGSGGGFFPKFWLKIQGEG